MEPLQGSVFSTWPHLEVVIFGAHWLFSKGAPWSLGLLFFVFVSGGKDIDIFISNVEIETGSVRLGTWVTLSPSEPVFLLCES